MKRILITGAHSYLGESFEAWAKAHYLGDFSIDTLDLHTPDWASVSFSGYDAVLHAAAIVHRVNEKTSDDLWPEYYAVNTELAVQVANKAKTDGVHQFIFLSSMGIYGDSKGYGAPWVITAATAPAPTTFYGKSKWMAEQKITPMEDENFNVAILRPPMIYGKGCKCNYPTLSKIARKFPVFPDVQNERSMLYIANFCEFLCRLIQSGKGGLYFPQDAEYVKTADMVSAIACAAGKRIWVTKLLNPLVALVSSCPGRIGKKANKAFGNMVYDLALSNYEGFSYHVANFPESVMLTEQSVHRES